MYQTAESRWQAVQLRDQHAATSFVYAVKTTRIFCRPNCPARLARRANVLFFDDCAAACNASYRPCKRCRPEQADSADSLERMIAAAKLFIQQQHGQVTLEQLAKHLKLSPRYVHHVFSKRTGCTPAVYASVVRQNLSDALTESGTNTLTMAEHCTKPSHAFDSDVLESQWAITVSGSSWSPMTDEVNWDDVDMFCSSTLPAQPSTQWQLEDFAVKTQPLHHTLPNFDEVDFDSFLSADWTNPNLPFCEPL